MKCAWGGLCLGLGFLVLACGSNSDGSRQGAPGSAGSAQNVAGVGGSDAAGNGGGGAGGAPITVQPQATCDLLEISCNQLCLPPGAAQGSCRYLFEVNSADGLLLDHDDVFVSGYFPDSSVRGAPPTGSGLIHIVGNSLVVTQLDKTAGHATALAVDGSTVYYMSPFDEGDGTLRSVGVDGSNPKTLLINLRQTAELLAIGGNLYFGAGLAGGDSLPRAIQLPEAGGDPITTPLGQSLRLRANTSSLINSWSGDIVVAPLPGVATVTTLMARGALPNDRWWVDDSYVYWQKGQSYKALFTQRRPRQRSPGRARHDAAHRPHRLRDIGSEVLLQATTDSATALYVMPSWRHAQDPVHLQRQHQPRNRQRRVHLRRDAARRFLRINR